MTIPGLERYHSREWAKNSKGNYVYARDGYLYATVFSNKWGGWQIVINASRGGFVQGEAFADADDAIARAEDILNGDTCVFTPLKHRY